MKDRIRKIMEHEQLSPSLFADKLQIGRAVISHILNGRNNPSLDVVIRILSKMDYIDSDWLLTGNGSMLKSEVDTKKTHFVDNSSQPKNSGNNFDLFSQSLVNEPTPKVESEYRKETVVKHHSYVNEIPIQQEVNYPKVSNRKVTKIIIYYDDNTFETFNADNRPL